MSERVKPKVADKEKARVLFELGDADDGDLPEDVDDGDGEEGISEVEMLRTLSLTDRARVIDVPAPDVEGGSFQIASNTMDPAFMREFRDSLSDLMRNK